jgi:hypothetical protein
VDGHHQWNLRVEQKFQRRVPTPRTDIPQYIYCLRNRSLTVKVNGFNPQFREMTFHIIRIYPETLGKFGRPVDADTQ